MEERSSRWSSRRRWELVALAPALIATALLVASTRLGDPPPAAPSALKSPAAVTERPPALTEPSPPAVTEPPAPPAAPQSSAPPRKTAPPSAPAVPKKQGVASRPFAWAPTAGASGYYIELYRGNDRVFAASTEGARIDVPATWWHDGKTQRLVPGEYRWFVWPVVDGERASTATVQSTLTVS